MIADTEIRLKGMETLMSVLGYVQAERFISLVMREPFDYTIWQRKLWLDSDIEEISHKAMLYRHQQLVGLGDHNISEERSPLNVGVKQRTPTYDMEHHNRQKAHCGSPTDKKSES